MPYGGVVRPLPNPHALLPSPRPPASAAASVVRAAVPVTAPARARPPAARERYYLPLALLCVLVAVAALAWRPLLKPHGAMAKSTAELLTSFEAAGGVPVSLWQWPDTGFSVRARGGALQPACARCASRRSSRDLVAAMRLRCERIRGFASRYELRQL